MSAERHGSSVRQRRDGRYRPARLASIQWPMVLWLTLVWVVLWGTWTPLTVVGGALVGVLVSAVFPLPPLRLRVRIRPWAVLVLHARFVWDVVVASLQVAWIVLRPPPDLRSALVRVPLRTESDMVLTGVALMTTLVPGSVVVEAHRSSHTLYLHALHVRDEADLERVRRDVWAQEERIIAAFGATGIEDQPEAES